MLGTSSSGLVAFTVLRLTSSLPAQSVTARTSAVVCGSSPAVSSTTRYPGEGRTPSHEPGPGVTVASGVGDAVTNPGPRVPIALGFACGADQSSADEHPPASTAIAASAPATSSRKRIILHGLW